MMDVELERVVCSNCRSVLTEEDVFSLRDGLLLVTCWECGLSIRYELKKLEDESNDEEKH